MPALWYKNVLHYTLCKVCHGSTRRSIISRASYHRDTTFPHKQTWTDHHWTQSFTGDGHVEGKPQASGRQMTKKAKPSCQKGQCYFWALHPPASICFPQNIHMLSLYPSTRTFDLQWKCDSHIAECNASHMATFVHQLYVSKHCMLCWRYIHSCAYVHNS